MLKQRSFLDVGIVLDKMHLICPLAGIGTHLQAFVLSKPKTMIKIAGKRIIDHIMERLQAVFPPNTPITFIVGYKKRIIEEYLISRHSDYFKLHFVEQIPAGYINEVPYFSGIGDAISLAEKNVEDDDCFIFFSDHLPTEEFSSMFNQLIEKELDGVLNVREVKDPQYYGVCEVDTSGRVKNVVEKPKKYISNLAITWGYAFSKSITKKMFSLLAIQANEPIISGRSHEFTHIIQKLIDDGANFGVNVMKSPILDFGRVEDFLAGNLYLLEHQGTNRNENILSQKIQDSTIIPPVYIGSHCKITSCIIGPNVSIEDNAILNRSIISETVIGENSMLENVITSKSLIGDFVSLENLIKNSIAIGDSSAIISSVHKE